MFNKVKLLTAVGDLVGTFTVLHFPRLTNHKGVVGYPNLLYFGERVFMFDQLQDAQKGGASELGIYVETMASAIVPIPGVDMNGFRVVDGPSEIPRRADSQQMSGAERAILNAMYEVEALPPDELLSAAGTLLASARKKVADFIDRELKKVEERQAEPVDPTGPIPEAAETMVSEGAPVTDSSDEADAADA